MKALMAGMQTTSKVSMAGIRATMTWIFSKKALNKATSEPCPDSPERYFDTEHNTVIGDFELGYHFDDDEFVDGTNMS